MFLHFFHSAWPQIAAGCHFHEGMGPQPFSHEARRGDAKELWLLMSLLLKITYPYRIVSEEAQLGRVVMDLTKMTEPFQSRGKGSCSIVSKKKKWPVWIHVLWWVYVRAHVLSFPAGRVGIYLFCDRLPLPSNSKAFGWGVQNLHFRATAIH